MKVRDPKNRKIRLANLVKDPSFINWAHGVDQAAAIKWEGYLQQNPHQQSLIADATLIIQGIQFAPNPVLPQVAAQNWQQLQKRLQTLEPTRPVKPISAYVQNYQYVNISFFSILVGVVGYWYFKTK